jgi:hypothetical protein
MTDNLPAYDLWNGHGELRLYELRPSDVTA